VGAHALVALSGGVDSAAALMTALESYEGMVRAAWVGTDDSASPSDARRVAGYLGVPFEVVDARENFSEEVIRWSAGMLARGLTPNPCARCNARIKLLSLFKILKDSEILVTGHHARMEGGLLHRGRDERKDQSYFLSMVERGVLERCVFPVGDMTKERARAAAESAGIPFRRKESMDLCFRIPSAEAPGVVADVEGRIIGRHDGIGNFTVGQRKGLGAYGKKVYVVSLDPVKRIVTVGSRDDLLSGGCLVRDMNWLVDPDPGRFVAVAQTRYRRRPAHAVIEKVDGGVRVEFREEEEAVAPGQVCAVYRGTVVLGGGIIGSATRRTEYGNEPG